MADEVSGDYRAVLFADIGDSTVLYKKLGDEYAHRLIVDCLASMEAVINRCHGSLLRTIGDAVLASFQSCDDAYLAAISMQQALLPSELCIRVGFHYGPVIADKGDVYGNAVNIAARVAGLAMTEEIMTTREVIAQLSPAYQRQAVQLQPVKVKGIDEPVAVYRLDWGESEDVSTTLVLAPVPADYLTTALRLSCGEQSRVVDSQNLECTIGRMDDSDIHTRHASTSRRHAVIKLVRGSFILTDQSSNGTYVAKAGLPAQFVHRDSMTLDGAGRIGAGFLPGDDDQDAIAFQQLEGPVEA